MIQQFTLEKAFKKVINERGLLTSLGYSKFDVQNLKRGKPDEKKMRKVIKDSKMFKQIQQELYEKK